GLGAQIVGELQQVVAIRRDRIRRQASLTFQVNEERIDALVHVYSHHLVVYGRLRVCSAGIGRAGRTAAGTRTAWARATRTWTAPAGARAPHTGPARGGVGGGAAGAGPAGGRSAARTRTPRARTAWPSSRARTAWRASLCRGARWTRSTRRRSASSGWARRTR